MYKYLCYKYKLNGANYINHTDWTLQNGLLKSNLFYADIMHLIEEVIPILAVSIYNFVNPNVSINKIVSISSRFSHDTL